MERGDNDRPKQCIKGKTKKENRATRWQEMATSNQIRARAELVEMGEKHPRITTSQFVIQATYDMQISRIFTNLQYKIIESRPELANITTHEIVHD